MRHAVALKYAAGTALLVFQLCSSGFAQAQSRSFELLHLWVTDAERHALASFSDPIRKQGVTWQEHGISSNFYGIRTTLAERFALNLAPSATFWIGGEGLVSLIESRRIIPIPAVVDGVNLTHTMVPDIREILRADDGYSAIPVGIHLQNHAIYSRKILDELQLSEPGSWREFLQIAPMIRAAGYTPLSVSDQRWQIRFLFVSVLASLVSSAELIEILDGKMPRGKLDQVLTDALEIFAALRDFASQDSHDKAWAEVILDVRENQAALSILGDFSCPVFGNNNDHIFSLAPGNDFVLWSFDVIAFVNRSTDTSEAVFDPGQEAALRVMTRQDARQNYIVRKGGVPAFSDIDLNKLEPCSKVSVRSWRESRSRVLLDAAKWGGQLNAVASVAQQTWRDRLKSLQVAKTEIADALSQSWSK